MAPDLDPETKSMVEKLLNHHFLQMAQFKFIPSLTELERDRLAWSLITFPEATKESSLYKLREEIKEILKDLKKGHANPIEYADALMCLLDSAGRAGLTMKDILAAFEHKLEINKKRTWRKNADNSYSHVKKDEHS